MTKTAISTMFRREGFTLIELLIVIVVMAILATMLVPVINKIIVDADTRRSEAFVQRVALASAKFKGENNGRYPGQDDIGLLAGTSPTPGYTGSQIIAARLFGYPETEIGNDAPNATSKYLAYKSYLLLTEAGKKNSLADDSKTAHVLLYFPSRLHVTAPSDCYRWADNSAYVGGGAPAVFTGYITDPRYSSGAVARNEGGILIIGTGADDIYMNADDIKSWEIK